MLATRHFELIAPMEEGGGQAGRRHKGISTDGPVRPSGPFHVSLCLRRVDLEAPFRLGSACARPSQCRVVPLTNKYYQKRQAAGSDSGPIPGETVGDNERCTIDRPPAPLARWEVRAGMGAALRRGRARI